MDWKKNSSERTIAIASRVDKEKCLSDMDLSVMEDGLHQETMLIFFTGSLQEVEPSETVFEGDGGPLWTIFMNQTKLYRTVEEAKSVINEFGLKGAKPVPFNQLWFEDGFAHFKRF